MDAKAENGVSREDILALVRCSSSKLRFMLICLVSVFTVFLIMCLIIGNTSHYTGYTITGILWCVLVYIYVFVINPRLVYRSFKKRYSDGAVIRYKFSDKKVNVEFEDRKKGFQSQKKRYADMFRIYETPEYFFFYFKRNETFIMKKDGISEGTADEISAAIGNEAGIKFVRKSR